MHLHGMLNRASVRIAASPPADYRAARRRVVRTAATNAQGELGVCGRPVARSQAAQRVSGVNFSLGDRLFPVYKKVPDRDRRLATDQGYHVPPRGDLIPRRLSAAIDLRVVAPSDRTARRTGAKL
jgi:hypothetical protein